MSRKTEHADPRRDVGPIGHLKKIGIVRQGILFSRWKISLGSDCNWAILIILVIKAELSRWFLFFHLSQHPELVGEPARVARFDLGRGYDGLDSSSIVIVWDVGGRTRVLLRWWHVFAYGSQTVRFAMELRFVSFMEGDLTFFFYLLEGDPGTVVRNLETCFKLYLTVLWRVFGFLLICAQSFACHFAYLRWRRGIRGIEVEDHLWLQAYPWRK